MTQDVKIWALLMLANELASKDYVDEFGDYSQNEEDDFVMTDEVDAVMDLATDKETLYKIQDLQQFIIDFYDKADRAGWELPWADADTLFDCADRAVMPILVYARD